MIKTAPGASFTHLPAAIEIRIGAEPLVIMKRLDHGDAIFTDRWQNRRRYFVIDLLHVGDVGLSIHEYAVNFFSGFPGIDHPLRHLQLGCQTGLLL